MNKIEWLRNEVMRVAVRNKKGHIAPSLSCLDILAVWKYEREFKDDTIILSKAHGCYGLYAIEADLGQIPKEDWENFRLCGTYDGLGSLGHGLPIGVGIAFGKKLQNLPGHVFVIVGDGELQEGSNWEALSFMKHHDLHNITMIVDHNDLQAIDKVADVMDQSIDNQLRGWGFRPQVCHGHDYKELKNKLLQHPQTLIAYTIKGKGFKCMEDKAMFHYRLPSQEELDGN